MKKKPFDERLKKLIRKIKIKVNLQYNEDTNLSIGELRKLFPHYAKAISKLSNIESIREELLLREDDRKIAVPMSMRNSSFKFFRCGGGSLIRKRIRLAQ